MVSWTFLLFVICSDSLMNLHILAKVNNIFCNKFFRNKCRLIVSVPAPGKLEDSLPAEVGCLKSFKGQGESTIHARGNSCEEYWCVGGQIEGNCFLFPFPI
jgi:hypothetical protein